MSEKPTLSVALATFNEQTNITTCLQSVKGLADEIIIYDESSTDSTRQIALKLGARVFKVKHEPIFHVTKNKAINKSRGKWILQLDADERLTPTLRQEIKDLIDNKSFGFTGWLSPLKTNLNRYFNIFPAPQPLREPAAAYFLPRQNFFLTRYLKHAGQYPDPVIRLFQKGKAILPAKDVHEQMQVSGRIGWLASDLDHYATPQFSRYLLRENRYSSLKAQQLYDQKIKINLLNTFYYLLFEPLKIFFTLYFRYRGFLDGFPGFVFCFYSALHPSFAYMKLWEIYKLKK